jgi:hypothetical protein
MEGQKQAFQPHPGFEKSAEWWWGILRRLFPPPSAEAFPPLSTLPSPEEREVIGRFMRQTALLMESEGLNGASGIRTSWSRDGSWSVDSNFPPYEALSGLAAQFRQLYSSEERGSFYAVMRILWQLSRDGSVDETQRTEALRTWSKAVARLRSKGARSLADEAISVSPLGPEDNPSPTPDEVIRIFTNAEHLHWDREKAEQLGAWRSHPVLEAHFQYEFHEAVAPLAYLSILFAAFVGGVLKRSEARAA